MKSTATRFLALALALCLLFGILPLAASAAQVTDDGHVLADPSILGNYTFPNNWSRPALEFCVASGILRGRDDGLAPNAYTTRAEAAALLVRLLGVQDQEYDLSGYTDVKAGEWYCQELASAVRIGIMNGTSPTTLAPNAPITREQVCTLFSRAFGIYPEDNTYYSKFTDAWQVSSYARNAVSALAEAGYLKGYEDGSVRPQAKITRAELAQLFYSLFTCICDNPADLPASGRVLYRGAEPIPEGYTLDGSLVIGCGYAGVQTLSGLTVSKTLTLRTENQAEITLDGCTLGALSVPAPIKITASNAVPKLYAAGKNCTLNLSAKNVWVYDSCTLWGTFDSLICRGKGISVTLNGTVESCEIQADNVILQGEGRAAVVTVYTSKSKITLAYGELVDRGDEYDYAHALETVQTVEIWDTVTRDTYLYSSSDLTGAIRRLPTGTKLLHNYTSGSSSSVYAQDGRFGWVPRSAISVPTTNYTQPEPYSTATLEGFVNQKGYSSSTKYLIWISLKTQTVNFFSGSKGNWKLYRSCPCSTGANETLTPTGKFSVSYKVPEWDFGSYKVRYVTGFYEGNAFHSRPSSRDYSYLVDATLGAPASHGCIRMIDADCAYIYNSIPYNTAVVVY